MCTVCTSENDRCLDLLPTGWTVNSLHDAYTRHCNEEARLRTWREREDYYVRHTAPAYDLWCMARRLNAPPVVMGPGPLDAESW